MHNLPDPFFLHRVSTKKRLGKVKTFQVGCSLDFYVKGKNDSKGEVQRPRAL